MRHTITQVLPRIMAVFILSSLFFILCPIGYAQQTEKTDEKKTEQRTDQKQKKDADTIIKTDDKLGLLGKEYKESDFKPKAQDDSYGWMVFKTLLILGLLVGGFYYFFRFVTKKAGVHLVGQDVIQVVSVVPIGQNKFLQVVDLAGKMLVLGVSDNNINVVSEITDKDEIDRIRLLSSKSRVAEKETFQGYIVKNISNLIEKVTEKKKPKEEIYYSDHIESGVDLSYLKKQHNRLKKMNGNDD